jgi:trimethylamine--corrinoid protein Co-methyltransferase
MMPAWAQLARYWQVPMYGTAGCSNAKRPDEQAAIESTLSILTSAQSGCHLVHDIGIVDAAMTVSMEALVMCDEIIDMVKRIMGGIEINEETLAVEVLHEVGPGGNFLEHDHTLKHFREHWRPTLMDRSKYEAWNKAGAKTMGGRLKEKTIHIIETHVPNPLPEEVEKELERIVSSAEKQARTEEAQKLG